MKLALWIIARCAPVEWRESIAGDLVEERRRRIARGLKTGGAWTIAAAVITTWRITREMRRGDVQMTEPRRFRFNFDAWLSDARTAVRSLAAARAFTAVSLAGWTLGIGASTAIFSVVDAVVLRGLPFDESDRLVAVGEVNVARASAVPYVGATTAPTFYDWRSSQHAFEQFAATVTSNSFIVRSGGRPERLTVLKTTAGFFDVLRVRPRIGRIFSLENERPGNERVAVISDAFWKRRFGGAPDIIGRTVDVDAGSWEIIGVMAPEFSYPVSAAKPTDMWVPFAATEQNDIARGRGRNYYLRVIARLRGDATIEQAAAEIDGITAQLARQYPKWYEGQKAVVMPLHEATVGSARRWMLLLLGSVGFVLLIACVNVANLMLARGTTRTREIGIRAALGASRWQIARCLLIESLLLSLAGTLLALFVASWGVNILRASLPASLPRMAAIGIDLRVLVVAALSAIGTGLLFGLLPALQFSRPNLTSALGEGGRAGMSGRERQRLRSSLVVVEVALAVVLLVGAGLFVSSFVRLVTVDLGLDYHNVLTVGVNPRLDTGDPNAFKIAETRTPVLMDDALRRIRAIPGVETASATQGGTPLSGSWYRNSITVPGKPEFTSDADQVDIRKVMPEYASVIRAKVTKGRYLNGDDTPGSPLVVVLNEESVRRFFGDSDPIGAVVRLDDAERRVIGVVTDVRLGGPESPVRPEAYLPWAQSTNIGGVIVMRTSVPPQSIAPAVRDAVQAVLPDVPVAEPVTMEASLAVMLSQRKFNMLLIGLFGVLAIVIAAVGIYGVMAYIVAQQTKEIGLRMALGALPRSILRRTLARALILMAAGTLAGFGAAWLLAGSVRGFLFGVQPHDPAVYIAVSAVLAGFGLVAAAIPARRAARVDPMVALRAD
jgi:predicted permease